MTGHDLCFKDICDLEGEKCDADRRTAMKVYEREEKHPFRWLVAAVVFVLVLTITFSDVDGFSVGSPSKGGNPDRVSVHQNKNTLQEDLYPGFATNDVDPHCPDDTAKASDAEVTAIPEPSTFLLMVGAIAALVAASRIKGI